MNKRFFGRPVIAALWCAGGLLTLAPAHANCGKLMRLIVGTAPGGGGDTITRLLATHLTGKLAEQVVVENKTGADGVIAAAYVAGAAPDGCTLLVATRGHMLRPFMTKKLPYDTLTDLVGVTAVTYSPTLIVASPMLPFDTPRAFVSMLQADPTKYNYATPEILGYISIVLFNHKTGVQATRVPYRGSAAMMTDLASGAVHYAATSISAARPLLAGGQLKAVGLASTKRSEDLPQVPTFREYGIDVVDYNRYGLFAPGKTPSAKLVEVQKAVAAVLKEPTMLNGLKTAGAEPVGNPVDEFQRELMKEYELFKVTAEQVGIVPE